MAFARLYVIGYPSVLVWSNYLFYLAFISIVAAVLITMIGVGVQNDRVPVSGTVETNLVTAFTSAANIVLSYG